MHNAFTASAESPARLHLIRSGEWSEASASLSDAIKAQAKAQGFEGGNGDMVIIASPEGKIADVLFGLGGTSDALAVAALSGKLPEGDYEVARDGGMPMANIAAGWADGAYRFDRYLKDKANPPRLVVGDGGDAEALDREADAIALLRDLINTPAQDMGPAGIEAAIRVLAEQYSADLSVITGDDLLKENYPMVHAVGRAAPEAPRFMELSWGNPDHPELALVGKGVAFDTGGLNLKPGAGMKLMKKDMGGSAHVIALAKLVMSSNLPVRLKLYVPAVENAIGRDAFRPSDILQTRKGLTVEIDNTDAEGRLILGDALTRACESDPDLLVDFATLTGAARVALGPDLAPFYTDDGDLADAITAAGAVSGDPVWRMPLWDPYKSMLKSSVADIQNSGGRFAGSITAAIFLKQFVEARRWVHLDVWGWRQSKFGRPEGAAACGLRAVWAMLRTRYA
ncbi:leucyl aminopeptidase family protein [Henriciella barbarensis]|uniref:Leucyl aminopeptidase family protein n=1 Tax=Henriciella barbarensis TaxID=86342 RepID=A0A399QZZ8_9PROT|nr:leucyl aminopeptidase family protein [Henriciella barbarensis]RIJ23645.1 leucyl aminopeptidase family protein [Henriciella barbarensis]